MAVYFIIWVLELDPLCSYMLMDADVSALVAIPLQSHHSMEVQPC